VTADNANNATGVAATMPVIGETKGATVVASNAARVTRGGKGKTKQHDRERAAKRAKRR
jgi:hypothetical protein